MHTFYIAIYFKCRLN